MKSFFISILIGFVIVVGATQPAAAVVVIETVPVGDTNNVADLTCYGAVQDEYKIGKTEVTVMQYCAFLNAVAKYSDKHFLYNSQMSTDSNVVSIQQTYNTINKSYLYTTIGKAASFPITYVSWPSAARFCNWLHNDQPEGNEDTNTTENGAYNLENQTGQVVPVEKDATWFLPSEDQWYKAAYYKGGGTNSGYWLYPTQHDTDPDNSMIGKGSNNANVFILKKVKNWLGYNVDQEITGLTIWEEMFLNGLMQIPKASIPIFRWCEEVLGVKSLGFLVCNLVIGTRRIVFPQKQALLDFGLLRDHDPSRFLGSWWEILEILLIQQRDMGLSTMRLRLENIPSRQISTASFSIVLLVLAILMASMFHG